MCRRKRRNGCVKLEVAHCRVIRRAWCKQSARMQSTDPSYKRPDCEPSPSPNWFVINYNSNLVHIPNWSRWDAPPSEYANTDTDRRNTH